MPTYDFRNKTTGVEWEKHMRISELDAYKEENNAEIIIKTVNIASGTGDNIDAKTDAVLNMLSEFPANPAIIAPTIITDEMALVTDSKGVCKDGVTLQTT